MPLSGAAALSPDLAVPSWPSARDRPKTIPASASARPLLIQPPTVPALPTLTVPSSIRPSASGKPGARMPRTPSAGAAAPPVAHSPAIDAEAWRAMEAFITSPEVKQPTSSGARKNK
ncbi:hypothetical protein Q5752_004687 [Cryptotrichosporon argae]